MLPVVVVWNERDRVCCCLLLSEAAKTMCRVGGGGGEVVARTAQELAAGAQQREKRVDGVDGGEGGLVLGILHSHSRDCCVCLPVLLSLECPPLPLPLPLASPSLPRKRTKETDGFSLGCIRRLRSVCPFSDALFPIIDRAVRTLWMYSNGVPSFSHGISEFHR